MQDDVKELKFKATKPNKATAEALLEYLAMEDGGVKQNMEILFGEEIKKHFAWFDKYCEENRCTQEQVLNAIINGDV